MNAVETVERGQITQRPAIKPGDTVKVHVKVREGDKERIQVFEGMVIGMHRGGARATFTVRKVSFGQGVERIFPLHSPVIDRIEVLRTAKVGPWRMRSGAWGSCTWRVLTKSGAAALPARWSRLRSSSILTITFPASAIQRP